MTSCALTNKPSQAGMLKPIINQAPAEEGSSDISTQEQELSDMELEKLKAELREELKEDILKTLREEVASMNACASEKAAEGASKAVNEDNAPLVDERAKLEAAEESKTDAGTSTGAEAAAEVKEQAAEEEKPAEEVIKIETLNSSPAPTLAPQAEAWRSMSQREFIQWIETGAYKR